MLVFQYQIQFPYFSIKFNSRILVSNSIPVFQYKIQFPYPINKFNFHIFFSYVQIGKYYVAIPIFHFRIGMLILSFGNFGTGKIPYSSVKVHFNFPTHGIAVVVKNYSTIRGFAAHGGIIIHHACYAIRGEIKMYLS